EPRTQFIENLTSRFPRRTHDSSTLFLNHCTSKTPHLLSVSPKPRAFGEFRPGRLLLQVGALIERRHALAGRPAIRVPDPGCELEYLLRFGIHLHFAIQRRAIAEALGNAFMIGSVVGFPNGEGLLVRFVGFGERTLVLQRDSQVVEKYC